MQKQRERRPYRTSNLAARRAAARLPSGHAQTSILLVERRSAKRAATAASGLAAECRLCPRTCERLRRLRLRAQPGIRQESPKVPLGPTRAQVPFQMDRSGPREFRELPGNVKPLKQETALAKD